MSLTKLLIGLSFLFSLNILAQEKEEKKKDSIRQLNEVVVSVKQILGRCWIGRASCRERV